MEGPLRGNHGVVRQTYVGDAALLITMGSETIEASLPIQHLRFSKKRTQLRKRKREQGKYLDELAQALNLPDFPDDNNRPSIIVMPETEVVISERGDEDQKIQKIVRRGLKNTRVLIGGQSVLLTNEELKRRLSGNDSIPEG